MKITSSHKSIKRERRHKRIRSQVVGAAERPRLAVFRSNRYIYAQIINDATGSTIVSASDIKIKKGTKVERANIVGATIAGLATKANVMQVVFDRGGFNYAGRVKALADAARGAGLIF